MQIRQNESSIKLKVFLKLFFITVVIGISAVAYTAPAQSSGKGISGRISFFDPFELRFIYLDVSKSRSDMAFLANTVTQPQAVGPESKPDAPVSSALIRRSPIRIPYRPPCRSPFRPPWVPGPPPWYPGSPPWAPGPPPWNPNP